MMGAAWRLWTWLVWWVGTVLLCPADIGSLEDIRRLNPR